MKHNRQLCLYCGKPINRHEMLYGACSACLKAKARIKKWHPDHNESGQWLYADMAPRMAEYIDPHDMDNEGAGVLLRMINMGTGVLNKPVDYDSMPSAVDYDPEQASRKRGPMLFRATADKYKVPLPDGTKKCRGCGAVIPFEGPMRCPACAEKNRILTARWRANCTSQRKCNHCGRPLPSDDYQWKNCPICRESFRYSKAKRKEQAQHE